MLCSPQTLLAAALTLSLLLPGPLRADDWPQWRGKACLYIKKLADVDLAVLREMIQASVAQLTGMSKPSKPAPAKKSRKN